MTLAPSNFALRLSTALLALGLFASANTGVAALSFHVAPPPLGSDDNSGTEAAPFATIARARDAIRNATGRAAEGQSTLPGDWAGAEVTIHGGTYPLTDAIEFDARDSGSSENRVVYRGRVGETVVITGGKALPVAVWKQVNDRLIRPRINALVRDEARVVNLRQLDLKDRGKPGLPGSGGDLLVDGERMTPARYPDEGWDRVVSTDSAKPTTFRVGHDRAGRWADGDEAWVHGYLADDSADEWSRFQVNSADQEITLASAAKGVRADQWFTVNNVLAELDRAGEWWYDAKQRQLVFLPRTAADLSQAQITYADFLLIFTGTNWVSFENVTLEACRSHAVSVVSGTGFELETVTIRNVGGWAVVVDGGRDVHLSHLVVTDTGEGGLWVKGGDRATLTPSGHLVADSEVRNFGVVKRTGSPGIRIEGVGITVSRCKIEKGPHEGIIFSGNEHTIEDSVFKSLCLETGTTGAIRADSDWTGRGTTIARNRFEQIYHTGLPSWADSVPQPAAMLLDDGSSGTTITENTITGCGYGVVIDGGRDNTIDGNTFSATSTPILVRSVSDSPGLEDALRAKLSAVLAASSTAWTSRYPILAVLLDSDPTAPKNTRITGNRVTDQNWLVDATVAARDHVDGSEANYAADGSASSTGELLAYEAPSPAESSYEGLEFFVSPSGSDSNNGTRTAPFATIARARDAVRNATGRSNGGEALNAAWRGGRVIFAEGLYHVPETISFDERDSGTEEYPIEYVADVGKKVVITGAIPVSQSNWSLVSAENDSYAWSRLSSGARGKVYRLNVAALGIDQGQFTAWTGDHENMLRLIAGDQMKRMSRFPDWPDSKAESWLKINNPVHAQDSNNGMFSAMTYEIADTSVRSWNFSEQDVFAYGALDFPYHIRWQPVDGAVDAGNGRTKIQVPIKTVYSPIPGEPAYTVTTQFVALRNALEAMTPGSYVWNKSRGNLYFWPENGVPSETRLTTTPRILKFGDSSGSNRAANWVTLRNLIIEGSRRASLVADKVRGLAIENCEFRNFGWLAAEIKNSTGVRFEGGSIHDSASRALVLHGGDERTLTSAGNVVDGVEIYEIGFDLNAEISTAVSTSINGGESDEGHGLTIRNCHMHDIRDGLISAISGGLTIEDCVFERFLTITGDSGGITGGFRFTLRDNAIRRCTFRDAPRLSLHHIAYGATTAVYLDMMGNWTIEDCTFSNLDHAIYFCGRNFTIARNTFTNCHQGHANAAIVALPRQGHTSPGAVPRAVLESDLQSVPLDNSLWKTIDPSLINYRADGTLNALLGFQHRPVIVDNVQTNAGAYLMRRYPVDAIETRSGVDVGVDLDQRNYPAGLSVVPVLGGGTVLLGSITLNSW